jgi:uncharacterized phage protein (TIGR02218 family)
MKSTVAPYQTAAWCVRIVTVSGLTIRLTTYPHDLTMSNATVYLTDAGYEQTAYSATTNFSPSAIDLTGIAGIAGITRDQIASGVFDNARVYVFKCDFLTPVEDYEPIGSGFFGKTTLEDDKYTIQGMSLIDALNQSVGKTYTAACSRTFGDSGCTKDLTALDVVGAVNIVTSNRVIRDTSRAEAADYFAAGTIQFTTGNNAGLKPLEIKSYAADGTITVHEPFYYLPQVGDTFVMIPGCRKRLEDCRDKWNNVINFFGFSNIPTSSVYTQVAGNR